MPNDETEPPKLANDWQAEAWTRFAEIARRADGDGGGTPDARREPDGLGRGAEIAPVVHAVVGERRGDHVG